MTTIEKEYAITSSFNDDRFVGVELHIDLEQQAARIAGPQMELTAWTREELVSKTAEAIGELTASLYGHNPNALRRAIISAHVKIDPSSHRPSLSSPYLVPIPGRAMVRVMMKPER